MEQISKEVNTSKILIKSENTLFFDLDGTLVETNYANYLAYKKAIESVLQIDSLLTYNSNQRINRSTLERSTLNISKNALEQVIKEKEIYYKEFLLETKINQVVVDILFEYSRYNKTVLVTNCREDRAITTLEHHNLLNKFAHLFYRTENSNEKRINKYQSALTELKVCATLVIAFENEESEITDALLAGIPITNIINTYL